MSGYRLRTFDGGHHRPLCARNADGSGGVRSAVPGSRGAGLVSRAATRLPAILFLALGAGIAAAYEIYWARVIVPESAGLAMAISVAADKLDPRNDGKLVHVVGALGGVARLTDPEFGVAVDALKLRRRVWMYQWEQGQLQNKSRTGLEDMRTHKETTLWSSRTYDYRKVWSEKLISSRSFYNAGHDNPRAKAIPDLALRAPRISLGVFAVSPELVEQIDNFQAVPVTSNTLSALPEPFRPQAKLMGEEVYFCANPGQPAIGDLKARLEIALPAAASVIAKQEGDALLPCRLAKAGSIALLRVGSYSVQEMGKQFAHNNSHERRLVWGAASLVMLFGLAVNRAITVRARSR